MKTSPALWMAAALGLAVYSMASAMTITLGEYAFNLDGNVHDSLLGGSIPAAVDLSGFDAGTGLGTVSVQLSGAGNHYISGFFDHDIGAGIYDESGGVSGIPGVSQSWEIDEPGYTFGNIFDHFSAGSLENSSAIPASYCNDVSMAMGWSFTLASYQAATISMILTENAPSAGFYLFQVQPPTVGGVGGGTVYFTGNLQITGHPEVPDTASTACLLGATLVGLLLRRKQG